MVKYTVFLSSPGDVAAERNEFGDVIDAINAQSPDDPPFVLIRWEDAYYTAGRSFQDQIEESSGCDLVVCIFWKRLGTELGEPYRRLDGTLPTGTEYEFEEAIRASTRSDDGVPDILVYRKTAPVHFSEEHLALEKAQRDRFLRFWSRWFQSESGQFHAAFHTFDDVAVFKTLVRDHLEKWLGARADSVAWPDGSPFRGLQPYEAEHAPIFFGRTREVERARARLLTNASAGIGFLLITGASGSGKSSLARAGLLPRLCGPHSIAPFADRALTILAEPAEKAGFTSALAERLFAQEGLGDELSAGDSDTPAVLARQIATQPGVASAALSRALDRAQARKGPNEGSQRWALILLVDQFEQLFSLPTDEAAAIVAFLSSLSDSGREGVHRIFVVATMRSDFHHRIAGWPALAALCGLSDVRAPGVPERILEIGPLGPSEITAIVNGSAHAAGLLFETRADTGESLAAIIEQEATRGSLPATQLLLSELYEAREGNRLTFAAHKSLGGVAGVMGTRAESVIADEGAAAFPALARSLVMQNGPDGVPVARTTELSAFASGTDERRLLDRLIDARLVVSHEGHVRLAHESLLSGWKRLEEQVAEDQRSYSTRDRLMALHADHRDAVTPRERRARLLRGLPLEEGLALLKDWGEAPSVIPTPLAAFVRESARAARWRLAAAVLGVILASGTVAATMFAAWSSANDAALAKRQATTGLDIARAEAAMRNRRYTRAVEAAVSAYDRIDNAETRSALATAISAIPPRLSKIASVTGETLAFVDDGTLLLADGAGDLITLSLASETRKTLPGTGNPILHTSPDGVGGTLALLTNGALIWLNTGGELVGSAPPPIEGLSLGLPHQGAIVAAGGFVYALVTDRFNDVVWEQRCPLTGPAGLICTIREVARVRATAVALSADGATVAYAFSSGGEVAAEVVTSTSEQPHAVPLRSTRSGVLSVALSPDAGHLAIGRADGSVEVFADLSIAPTITRHLAVGNAPPVDLRFSPDGKDLAFVCGNESACMASVGDGRPTVELSGHIAGVRRLAFAPDGQRLATLSGAVAEGRRTIMIWQRNPDERAATILSTGTDHRLPSISTHRHEIAAGDKGGRVWLWDGPSDPSPRVLPAPSHTHRAAGFVAYSPNGDLAAAYDADRVTVWPAGGDTPAWTVPLPAPKVRLAWLAETNTLAIADGVQLRVVEDGEALPLPLRVAADGVASGRVPDELFISRPGGILASLDLRTGDEKPIASREEVNDRRSAMSLNLHPDGRWLAATRSDNQLKVYDVTGRTVAVTLSVFSDDTKVTEFSPDGTRLMALGSDGRLYVWHFAGSSASAALAFAVDAVPPTTRAGRRMGSQRSATWATWLGSERIAIATTDGEVVTMTVDPLLWRARALSLGLAPPRADETSLSSAHPKAL